MTTPKDGVKGTATVKESLTAGVPAFDLTQPCALGPGGNPLATECPRCKNPHHACDHNALGVAVDRHQTFCTSEKAGK
jgi:hypothetical protein